ncbi:gas vesicle structural protein GvpA [Bacillus sp. sid0103]|jgi:gas vesicle structural protein|uniref:gas vesicle protein GvpJ n=1 Tax=Bacillus sp. sid0103 TaxID=2856337 RepID=UPI001C43E3AB|nr:gas vesicle protein GvpJ [Bacillus sp. sid0103]MBV7504565.1 gas vesicle structural protein GvpA [Bacillus sp. sid0103]
MAAIQKSVDSSSLAEVIDRILDKGVVIDLWARVSLVGIELLTIDARIVIASVDTWLRYAEAVGLLKHDKHHLGDESGLEAAL